MGQNIVIYIGIGKTLSLVGSAIFAVGWGAWYTSGRLTKVETMVGSFGNRLTGLEGRLDNAFKSQSPVSLTDKGHDILVQSSLQKYIDDNTESFMQSCGKINTMKTAYDVQSASFQLFDSYTFPSDIEVKLKEEAYKAGLSMSVLKRIGAIYFRDLCLARLGLDAKDLDKSST